MTSAPATRQLPIAARSLLLATTSFGLVLAALLSDASGVLFFGAYAGIGTYLAIRRPANSVGWLLLLAGWGLAAGTVRVTVPLDELLAGELAPAARALVWASACGWALGLFGFVGITVVFPDGHLPPGRGGSLGRLAIVAWLGLVGLLSFQPTVSLTSGMTGPAVEGPNPIALAPEAAFWNLVPDTNAIYTAMLAIVVGGLLSLILRYRQSVGIERLRYRWLVAAITLAASVTIVWAVTSIAFAIQSDLVWIAVVIGYLCVPVAIAVAVLRYRLFEIDRIVSRTIAYASVSVILAAIFGACVLILSSVLASFADGETLAVAGSTLVACVALQPVLGRVRRGVDRRFDRAGYDAERTLLAFRDRVRSETDIEAVTSDLTATARSAVIPASTSLWLRPRRADR